jgi:hypothetical protein
VHPRELVACGTGERCGLGCSGAGAPDAPLSATGAPRLASSLQCSQAGCSIPAGSAPIFTCSGCDQHFHAVCAGCEEGGLTQTFPSLFICGQCFLAAGAAPVVVIDSSGGDDDDDGGPAELPHDIDMFEAHDMEAVLQARHCAHRRTGLALIAMKAKDEGRRAELLRDLTAATHRFDARMRVLQEMKRVAFFIHSPKAGLTRGSLSRAVEYYDELRSIVTAEDLSLATEVDDALRGAGCVGGGEGVELTCYPAYATCRRAEIVPCRHQRSVHGDGRLF